MYYYFCDDKHENLDDNEIILQCPSQRFENIVPEKDSLITINDELWHVNTVIYNYAENKQVIIIFLITRVKEIKEAYEAQKKLAEEQQKELYKEMPKDINEYVEREFLFNEKK